MFPSRSPYAHLLEEDENFRRWYENTGRGSPTTAAISYYLAVNGGGQQQVVALAQVVMVAPRGTMTFSVNPSFQSVGMMTSYGNVWWSS
ncbi:MAG: hypothetical protein JRN64_03355 [Nitrososphaerota archaeon]|nr:hypothetical protein [Nitrososphaerota archaeon]